jgi:hypothetical protein
MTDAPSSATKNSLAASPASVRDDSRARAVLRGTQRLLRSLNFESLSEVSLANGRRADVLAVGRDGETWIIEIKSSIADFRTDQKWHEYREYCDALLFAVAPDFPSEILPADAGLILADAYAGELVRAAPRHPLTPARRKALMLSFARTAATRLLARIDPSAGIAMD